MHAQILRTGVILFLITYSVSGRRSRPSRPKPKDVTKGNRFFCRGSGCEQGKYCNKQNMCVPTKLDGQTCSKDEECMSEVCLKVCKACKNDGDCPSKGSLDKRLIFQSVDESKAYCVDNECVACEAEEHCTLGRVCTSDNKCEQCDTNEDCKPYLRCERGDENWCVECYKDEHCPASNKRCVSKRCVECKVGSDCPTGRCDYENKCIRPLCDGLCVSNAGCISGLCQFHSEKATLGTCKYCGADTF